MDTLLHMLLALRRHARIAVRQSDPVFAAFDVQAVPFMLERPQDRLLLGRQPGPCFARVFRMGGRDTDGKEKRQDYCCGCV